MIKEGTLEHCKETKLASENTVNTIDSPLFSKLFYNWSKIITHSESGSKCATSKCR